MPQPEKEHRNIGVLTLFLLGLEQAEIARLYEVSRQRVKQILDKQFKGMINDKMRDDGMHTRGEICGEDLRPGDGMAP